MYVILIVWFEKSMRFAKWYVEKENDKYIVSILFENYIILLNWFFFLCIFLTDPVMPKMNLFYNYFYYYVCQFLRFVQ